MIRPVDRSPVRFSGAAFVLTCFFLSVFREAPCSGEDGSTGQKTSERIIEWVKQEGGSKHDKIRGITVDAEGNCYVTGEFTDEARFADRTVTSRGSMDFVLAKYSPDGKLLWLQTAGGSEIDRGYSVAVDATGNSYVTGHFQSPEFRVGDRTFRNRGDYDYYVAKFDAGGTSNGHTMVVAQATTMATVSQSRQKEMCTSLARSRGK